MKYHVARESEQLGEFNDLDISAGLRSGQFQPGDVCWNASMSDWESLAQRFAPAEPEAGTPPPLPVVEAAPARLAEDLNLASRIQRFTAWLIDSLSLVPVIMLGVQALGDKKIETMEQLMNEVQAHPEPFQPAAWTFLLITLVNVVMLTLRGQSIGKWITGIRIVMFQSGARAGFVRAVLLRSFVMSVLGSISYIGTGLQFFDIACIFRADHRCLHDLIADTMVVRVRRGEG